MRNALSPGRLMAALAVAFSAVATLSLALLAGCGALPVSPSRPGAATQVLEGKSRSLLYVIVGIGDVNIVTYPEGNRVASIDYGFYSYLTGECSDRSGNVWIADYATLFEYAHGGTKEIGHKSFRWDVAGCSVDPASNDLATVGEQGRVYVFSDERRKTHVYHTNTNYTLRYCTYDADGDLFVDGVGTGATPVFFELPSGSSKLVTLTLDKKIGNPGQIQWDGRYVAIQDRDKPYHIYQVTFSGTAGSVVNTVALAGLRKPVGTSWIEGNTVLVPYRDRGHDADAVGLFNYPAGGNPVNILKGSTYHYVTAVTVSKHREVIKMRLVIAIVAGVVIAGCGLTGAPGTPSSPARPRLRHKD